MKGGQDMDTKKTNEELQMRLETINNIYNKMGTVIDKVFESVPSEWIPKSFDADKMKQLLTEKILGDEELKKLLNSIENKRVPRFMLVGRTGVGKSSLINAICDMYLAEVSDVTVGTKGISQFEYKRDNETVLEVLDTRGIGESLNIGEENAENELLNAICDFEPDIILFVLKSKSRDRIDIDVNELKKIARAYYDKKGIEIPTIAVLNQVDELEPASIKNVSEYTSAKKKNIDDAKAYFSDIFTKNNFYPQEVIAVSSLMEWSSSHDEISKMTPTERENIKLQFDGRYKIDELVELIQNNIPDEAAAGLIMAARMQTVLKRVAKRFVNIFMTISSVVALTPIPVSDIFILIILQMILVLLIAALSGEDVSVNAAKKFVFGAGGIGLAGNIFKFGAQQLTKFVNLIFPAAGSAVSSAIAAVGTKSIGEAAIAVYIDEKKLSDVKKALSHKEEE